MMTWRQTEWGWLTALAMFLEGLCGATIVVSLVLGMPLGVLAGTVCGILAGLTLLLEAGNPKAARRLFSGLGHAWMSRGTLLLTICIVFGLAYALPAFSPFAWLPWNPSGTLGKMLGIVAAVAGLLLMLYPGLLLGSMKPFPLWRSMAGPSSLLGAAISGLGLLLTGAPIFPSRGILTALTAAAAATIVVQLLALWASLDSSMRGPATVALAGRLLLHMPVFLWGAIVVGLIVPLALLAVGALTPGAAGVVTLSCAAGLHLLLGQFCLRYATLAAGVRVPIYPIRI